ncbi:Purine-nucleoside phosphorylase [Mesomycoplasma conjunctivae]|uniref:Uridine phosphorylase n=1 Tax=Mesomycoplasma conjunctivae (strain ATCC 25834 / NCTC 10147 / HRC/581) TaxID=572263 RepID=C5J6Z6_MESCH|nr:purine-nucleoside phosphorylase [Mesomycoplasma conjunctivae]CAT05259.1 Purine-nucleoside phosphorylase [Mesomycoplasma conjunctivae]VEU66486.1 Purine-nucleoside phosphorylase [Mesomycoplasma conjunctivae]
MTPHISASKNEIAPLVLMPGDPLRAKFIADNFLENAKLVSSVRNMFIYTGSYKGREVTIAASGMGSGSIGIYAYELFKFYDVEKIIRLGSAGSYTSKLNVNDLIIAKSAYADSCSFAKLISGKPLHNAYADKDIIVDILASAQKQGIKITLENVHSTDVFYSIRDLSKTIEITKASAVEMESYALFTVANALNKKAGSILTISDSLITGDSLPSSQREQGFRTMIKLALEIN